MDMGVRAGDHLAQQIADLEADKLALLDRVAEQEGENADLYELGDRWLHLRTTRTGAAALRLDGVARGRDPIAAMIPPSSRQGDWNKPSASRKSWRMMRAFCTAPTQPSQPLRDGALLSVLG